MGTLVVYPIPDLGTVVGGRSADFITQAGWYSFILGAFADGTVDQNLIDGINGDINIDSSFLVNNHDTLPGYDASIQFTFNQGTAIFSLDGAPAISFNSLPAGLMVATATAHITTGGVDIDGSITGDTQTGLVEINGVSVNFPQSDGISNFIIDIPFILSPVTPLVFIGKILQITLEQVTNGGGLVGGLANISNFSVIGTYTLQQFDWTIDTPGPVHVGDKITVTSADDGGLKGVEDITLTYDDGGPQTVTVPKNFIIIQEDKTIIFYVPWGFGTFAGDFTVNFIGNGIQFSGSVPLGTLPILFEDGSGIYRIVLNKTADTIYDRDNPGDTVDIEIPSPFIKTGFTG